MATYQYFNETKKLSAYSKTDRLLLWPAWIAESLNLKKELVEKLLKECGKQEKALEKRFHQQVKSKFLSKQPKPLTEKQKALFQKTIDRLAVYRAYSKRNHLIYIANYENSQEKIDFSPRQLKKLDDLRKSLPSVKRPSGELFYRLSEPTHFQQVEEVLTSAQKKVIEKACNDEAITTTFYQTNPNYRSLFEAIQAKPSEENMGRTFSILENHGEELADMRDKLIQKSLQEILKIAAKKDRSKIEKYLGFRTHQMYCFQMKLKTLDQLLSPPNSPAP